MNDDLPFIKPTRWLCDHLTECPRRGIWLEARRLCGCYPCGGRGHILGMLWRSTCSAFYAAFSTSACHAVGAAFLESSMFCHSYVCRLWGACEKRTAYAGVVYAAAYWRSCWRLEVMQQSFSQRQITMLCRFCGRRSCGVYGNHHPLPVVLLFDITCRLCGI